MRNFSYYLLIALVFILIGWFANTLYHMPKSSNPIAQIKPTPLAKYTIENLAAAKVNPAQIQIGDLIKDYPTFTSNKFFFSFDPALSESAGQAQHFKKVSGMINIPKGKGLFPLIVMVRGYVDKKDYFIGNGTLASGQFFAQNGFITVSPDFLGYGESDKEASDVFEERFQTYTTVMTLLKSVNSIQKWDGKNIFIWGHSNGGQIVLEVLEVTQVTYPTVLWAPVSKPFPYSILYYTDDIDDHGKALRAVLSKFEEDYDVEKYSLTNYINRIKAIIQLNQGTADKEVPQVWSDNLNKSFNDATISAIYIIYPGNDHNMLPDWNSAIENNLTFFQKHLK